MGFFHRAIEGPPLLHRWVLLPKSSQASLPPSDPLQRVQNPSAMTCGWCLRSVYAVTGAHSDLCLVDAKEIWVGGGGQNGILKVETSGGGLLRPTLRLMAPKELRALAT